jgi:colanic acid biosynthesis glycosyl transferase WcaI
LKILITGLNYAPELTGVGKYTAEMAEFLIEQGHEVRVLAGPPYYPEWRRHEGYSRWAFSSEKLNGVTVYRCPIYVPANPGALSRVLHLASFALSSFLRALTQVGWRPDLVIAIEPTLFAVPSTLILSALTRSRRLLHIQDFEVDALLGLGFLKVPVIGRLARAIEGFLLRRFSAVSTISRSMMALAEEKGVSPEQLLFLPNWVDAQYIQPRESDYFRQRWGIAPQTRVVLYSGNMGKKQGLEHLLEVARQLEQDPSILFMLVGDGAARPDLEQLQRDYDLQNVMFKPLQPYDKLVDLLNLADVHVVCQLRGAADIVLPSKLTGILAVGGYCVVTADADTELGRLAAEHPGAIELVEPESAEALAAGIRTLLPKRAVGFNSIARDYAQAYLDREVVLGRYNRELMARVGQS